MMLFLRELVHELDLISFKNKYERLSHLNIPLEYLYRQKVYGFYNDKDEILGGFILGFDKPFRTITSFSSNRFQDKLHQRIMGGGNVFEICCFWLKRPIIRNPRMNAKAWLLLGQAVESQSHRDYIIYGTHLKGLALLYNYPKNSFLYHQETLNEKSNYIFISKREFFISGAKEIIFNKNGERLKQAIEYHFDPVIDLLLEMRDKVATVKV